MNPKEKLKQKTMNNLDLWFWWRALIYFMVALEIYLQVSNAYTAFQGGDESLGILYVVLGAIWFALGYIVWKTSR